MKLHRNGVLILENLKFRKNKNNCKGIFSRINLLITISGSLCLRFIMIIYYYVDSQVFQESNLQKREKFRKFKFVIIFM